MRNHHSDTPTSIPGSAQGTEENTECSGQCQATHPPSLRVSEGLKAAFDRICHALHIADLDIGRVHQAEAWVHSNGV